jgi:hypothetical protein
MTLDTISDVLIPIAFVAIGMAIAIAIWVAVRRRLALSVYRRRPELFSAAELQFLRALDTALPRTYRIFGKVRVADLVDMKPGLQPRRRQAALNRIAYKHFDFVVCDAITLAPLSVIELNDSSHLARRTRQRDEMLSKICNSIALPLVSVQAAASYDPVELQSRIAAAIHQTGTAVASS